MVLNAKNGIAKNGNRRARVSSNAQNIPPRTSASRSLVHRLRNSVEAIRRHTRSRPSPSEASLPSHGRKGKKKATQVEESPLSFDVPHFANRVADVEMTDATTPKKTRITLIKELARPQFQDIDPEKIAAIDENLVDMPLDVLRMNLDVLSPEFVQSLASVTVLQKLGVDHKLNNEVSVLVNESTAILPSHVLAVTSTLHSGTRRKVHLYPVHSLVLATQCANMPTFPPSPTISIDQQQPTQEVKMPIQFIAIPHPASFAPLLMYLYCKDPAKLFKDLMPLPPSPTLLEDPSQVAQYATKLAMTFTPVALLRFAALVHGLWQNVCAFSIDDETLWGTIDLMWEAFIVALTISSGQRQPAALPQNSESPQNVGLPTSETTPATAVEPAD